MRAATLKEGPWACDIFGRLRRSLKTFDWFISDRPPLSLVKIFLSYITLGFCTRFCSWLCCILNTFLFFTKIFFFSSESKLFTCITNFKIIVWVLIIFNILNWSVGLNCFIHYFINAIFCQSRL